MTNTQALIIGAAILVGSVLFASLRNPAEAEQHGGPYQLMQHSNPLANAGVFRLDTTSGGVSYCYISANQSLTCSGEVK